MLYLIGIGINDEKDISLKGIEAIKKCENVFMELYTCPIHIDLKNLEKLTGKKIRLLERNHVEDEEVVLNSAKTKDTAFLVGGDALSATTHTEIILDAKKLGIDVKIIHASSIFTAIAETGLMLYKFGKTVSLPFPQEGYFPTTPYTNIKDNLDSSLHTLLLLDIGMSANKAIEILLELEEKMNGKLFDDSFKLVIVAHLGGDSLIKYDTISNLKNMDFGIQPHALIIPSKLHFHEEEFLELF
ncbi:MAG: diphthine synthase [Candidatus Aenigmarchaeota archaeon]|nr:diphthine synthase [Candidatus Aenigmarchaeota archaeon]